MVVQQDLDCVVVTGGAGFIGSHLCERLCESGTKVWCLDNMLTGTVANVGHLVDDVNFHLTYCDVTAGVDVPGPVDFVLHLASPASPVDYLRLPIPTLKAGSLGTLNALDLAARKGARFLLASTSEVYGDPLLHPQPEGYWGNVNPVGPRSVYDEAKRFAEALTAAYHRTGRVDSVIVRIFNTYGPRMRSHDGRAVPTFIRQALADEPLTVAGDGLQTRSLCYVDDTVDGILAAAASGHPGPLNIGNPEETTVLDLARCVRRLTRSHSPIVHVEPAVDDPKVRCPDISLGHAVLDWRPRVPANEGLARTIAWFAGQGAGDPRTTTVPAPEATPMPDDDASVGADP
ncbi:NAD-dependent epimerase/dehydratase family protein [Actinomadura sp. KC345]|uniref:NAD-dependent epimerase/dehydratase family protein n=1 Tax=Actinomadura sp. KC345 TaxID=2530371 RepID=UPI001049F555|nr:NAD-dependent epimerase/dehydratase family protein [Actinomadura sp. KC345]TDC50221.1 NAD-dependent epimerase/dehydratase family protein [Actinomadura sp. KC345]